MQSFGFNIPLSNTHTQNHDAHILFKWRKNDLAI